MEETIDYAEEYLQLKNKEMWHKAETYAQLEENSLKEKSQFNDFVNFKVKQGRKQLAEEIMEGEALKLLNGSMGEISYFYKVTEKKLQKEVE